MQTRNVVMAMESGVTRVTEQVLYDTLRHQLGRGVTVSMVNNMMRNNGTEMVATFIPAGASVVSLRHDYHSYVWEVTWRSPKRRLFDDVVVGSGIIQPDGRLYEEKGAA